jgi:hypothetical protein
MGSVPPVTGPAETSIPFPLALAAPIKPTDEKINASSAGVGDDDAVVVGLDAVVPDVVLFVEATGAALLVGEGLKPCGLSVTVHPGQALTVKDPSVF